MTNISAVIDSLGMRPLAKGVRGATATVRVERERFPAVCTALVHQHGFPLSVLFVTDDRATEGSFGVYAVFAHDVAHERLVVTMRLPEKDPRYESLTKTIMAAHWYERYAMDMFGIIAEGHPDPRRLVHHENVPEATWPLRKDFAWNTKLAHADVPYPMHHVSGDGIFEIPVGPIHAGVIEPGHFRFNVAGERMITLEGKLFFTHKGVEKLLEGTSVTHALPYIERLSGDMAASHALAFCQAVETIAGVEVPARAAWLRVLVAELERFTMHIHDLANIAGNGTGYTVVGAQGFRVKERLVRLSASVCGNRFWRGLVVPGGIAADVAEQTLRSIAATVDTAYREVYSLLDMALTSDGFRERLETTGVLSRAVAQAYGASGIAARASGWDRDVRRDFPYAAYGVLVPRVITETTGDVYARFLVRVRELEVTAKLIERIVRDCPSGAYAVPCTPSSGMGIGAVESWRGEILTVLQMEKGLITRCFPRDPSFCNWALFGELAPGNIVPDFPLCNKSLNLSYAGNDL